MAKTSNQPLPKNIDTMGEEMMTVFNDELFSRLVCHFCHRKSPKETFVVKNGTVTGEAWHHLKRAKINSTPTSNLTL